MGCLTCHGLITNGNCGCSTGTQGAASVNIDIMLRDRDAGMVMVPREMVERIGKYAREDRMVTPGSTRLARLLADLDALLKEGGG